MTQPAFASSNVAVEMMAVSMLADQRKTLFDFDQVMNTQRENVYASRRAALLSDDLSKKMIQLAEKTSDDILEARPLVISCLHMSVPIRTLSTILSHSSGILQNPPLKNVLHWTFSSTARWNALYWLEEKDGHRRCWFRHNFLSACIPVGQRQELRPSGEVAAGQAV